MNTSEGPQPSAEPAKKGLRGRWRGAKEAIKTTFALPDPIAEAARIESIKVEIRQGDKDWAKKDVDISSLNIKDLPINWGALTQLGYSINDLKNDPYDARDLAEITPPREAYVVLPHIASVIAHHRNPEIPITLPTEREIKALRPWLAVAGGLIGKISDNWGGKFNRYIEERGGKVVEDIGNKVCEFADAVSTVENPKHQLLQEVKGIYTQVATPIYEEDNSLFGFFLRGQREVPVEDKIATLVQELQGVRAGHRYTVAISADKYPLLNTILPVVKFPPYSLDPNTAGIAGAEFMDGIARFLRSSGVRDIPQAPSPKQFDLFDFRSWQRMFAEIFVPERLERVREVLPNLLTQSHNSLPTSGPQLANKIYEIAEDISVLKEQGHYSYDIAKNIFR